MTLALGLHDTLDLANLPSEEFFPRKPLTTACLE